MKTITTLGKQFFILLMLSLFGLASVRAATPAGYSEFFIPVDEDNEFFILNALGGIAAGQNMRSVISMTAWADNTTIYYDHWENGYDFDPNDPSTTADENCSANRGSILNFDSSVPLPRLPAPANCTGQAHPSGCTIGAGGNTNYCYDGRDRVYVVGGGVTMVRAGWPQTTGVVTGVAEEVYPIKPQLTTYILPFGEDLYVANNARLDYRRVFAIIQATEDGTILQVDFNHDGVFDPIVCDLNGAPRTGTTAVSCTLNKGDTYRLDNTSDGSGNPFATLNSGTVIQGSNTLQVQYINGDSAATYNSRSISAFPRGFWGSEYYAPVDSGATRNTDIVLHNPNASAITINWNTTTNSNSFNIPANSTVFFQAATGSYVPNNSGLYLKGSGTFWALSDVDVNSSVMDWSYSLVPSYFLDKEQYLSWSPGCYSTTTGLGCAGTAGERDNNGVFITPAQDNTTIFVDRDNNGTVDYQYTLNRLQSQYVYDTVDGDLTGAHIWATGPYALAYGENPDTAPDASPGLDAGYTTLPNPGNWMDLALTVAKSANPVVLSTTANPAITTYTLTVNSENFNLDSVSVTDTLAADWRYVIGTDTTTITFPNGSTSNANPTRTGACDTDGGSCTLTWSGLGSMAPNQTLTIVFTARTVGTPNYTNGALSRNTVQATATRTVGAVTQTFTANDFAFNTYLNNTVNMTVAKTSSVGATTPVSPGDTFTYTVTVSNPATSTANLTNVAIYDPLPAGISYVAGSGQITGLEYYRDRFSSANYANSGDNLPTSLTWATQWFEQGEGTNPTAGTIQIVSDTGVTPNQNVLRVQRSNRAIARKADLSNYSGTTLSLNYRRFSMNAASDQLYVQICANATLADGTHTCSDTGSWNTIQTFSTTTDAAYQSYSYVIPATYRTANFALRFTTNSTIGNNEGVYFDNVQIAGNRTWTAGTPPDFVSGYAIAPGDNLQLTFNVKVDNPLATGITEIHNTAYSSAAEIPIPISDDARNIVNNPSANNAQVSGYIWQNTNGDSNRDVGEPGLANIQVTLKDQYGAPIATTTTDSAGRYSFGNVTPGNGYYVEVTGGLPAGLSQNFPTGNTNNRSATFNLTAGANQQEINVGYRGAAGTAIGDRVWSDANGNQVQDAGEPGIGGVKVRLYTDTNGNGVIDTGETYIETTTGPGGSYLFTGVAANGALDYIVYVDPAQTALSAYNRTTPAAFSLLNVASGGSYLNADFGFQGNNTSTDNTITDRIWLDANGNGSADGGESGIAGVTVDLLDNSGNVIATTATDANGNFTFSGVANGVYQVRVTDTANKLTDHYGTTSYAQNSLRAGITVNNVNVGNTSFGYNVSRAIGDTVFNDLNGNSAQDSGETGISGVTVLLYRDVNSNGVFEPGGADGGPVGTLTTDANGKYLFSGLNDGRYWVSIDNTQAALSGFTRTTADDVSGSAGDQRVVNLSGGASQLGIDYGYRASSGRTLSGRFWNDSNNNGADDSEPGLAGVTVELYNDANGNGAIDAGETRIGATTTATNGSYSFTGVPGSGTQDYIVRVTDGNGVLSGYTTTYEKTEGAKAASYNGRESILNLNGDIANLNFGFYKPIYPTYAPISKLQAYAVGNDVIVEWRTAVESGTLGFFLERLDPETGTFVALHDELLPGFGTSLRGGRYWFLDKTGQPKQRYTYRLIEVEMDNNRLEYGPFEVKVKDNGEQQIADWDAALRQTFWRDGFAQQRKEPSAQEVRDWNNKRDQRQAKHRAKPKKAFKEGDSQLRIMVNAPGLYKLTVDEIANAFGVKIDLISNYLRKGKLALGNGGQAVAYLAAPDNSALYFYGQGLDTVYTDANVYWLGVGDASFMATRPTTPPKPDSESRAFLSTQRWAKNLGSDVLKQFIPLLALIGEPDSDYWYWGYVYLKPGASSVTFSSGSLDAPGAVNAGSATVAVELRGAGESTNPISIPDHHAEVLVNGVVVGSGRFNGTDHYRLEARFDLGVAGAPVILPQGNVIEVRGVLDQGVPRSTFYVRNIELTYPRAYRALNNALAFGTGNYPTVTVEGFTGSDVTVLDVSDARRPMTVAATVEAAPAGGYRVAVAAQSAQNAYLATTLSAAKSPKELVVDSVSTLKDTNNAADYLVIAPDSLQGGAEALVALRDSKNMTALYVDLQDIYNAFNYGIEDAHAIKDFLTYAYGHWKKVPAYVVLAGKGTFDPRNFWGFPTNVLPVLMVDSPNGMIASDNRYADVAGNDGVPEMAIGRIPALSDDELLAYADKLRNAETAAVLPDVAAWRNRAIMIADAPHSAGNFPADSDEVIKLLPSGTSVERDYYQKGQGEAYDQTFHNGLLSSISSGAGLVNYIGHGSFNQLGNTGFFTQTDVAALTNGSKLPIMAGLTCRMGWDTYPGLDSLARTLILSPTGGIAAALAPSGMSYNDSAIELNKAFVTNLVTMTRPVRIGDAVLETLYQSTATVPRFMIDMYNVTGDPAAVIPFQNP
jgi:uncharacterized repeat protein (TIGR01451 family)